MRNIAYFGEPENLLYEKKTPFTYPPADPPPGFAVTLFLAFLYSVYEDKAGLVLRVVLLFALLVSQHVWAQRIVIRKSDSAGRFVFLRGMNGTYTEYSEPYGAGWQDEGRFMTRWSTSGNGDLFWTDGQNIYKTNWKRSDLLFRHLQWVLELFVRGDNVYVVYNPKSSEGPADNRYDPNIQFCRIHISNGVREDLKLPRGFNVTGLTVSPNEKWISFFDTKGGRYRLVLYNLPGGEMRIIDSADHDRGGSFGDEDKKNSSCWVGPDSLIYYKYDGVGHLMLYRVGPAHTTTWLAHFPERDPSWFSVVDGYLYCSDRLTVYRTRDGLKKQVEFRLPTYRSVILGAEIVR